MDEVTGGIARVLTAVILISLFIIGFVGIVRRSENKKQFVVLLIIPILLTYSMYFSGSFRRAPFGEENVQELIKIVSASYDSEEGLCGSAENGVIEYTGFIHEGKLDSLYSYNLMDNLIDSLFSHKGIYNDMAYYIGPASSDKGGYWTSSCHVGYNGTIAVQIDNNHYLEMHYKISRGIDKCLGFFYAPPLFTKYKFAA